ncbi:MAG TPA: T9SS type A sorting domain-containing protein, partial [Flavobacterium sp.]|nr:T9SS type A sorting domain-containing protein [Flavobacterium sp.]
ALPANTIHYVWVRSNCGGSTSAWVGTTFRTLCNFPTFTTTTPGSVCGQGTVALAAAGTGVIKWYAAQTGGNPLATGATFTTPSLTSTTSYWAELADEGANTPGGARVAPAGTSGTTPSTYGLVFDAVDSFILNSVDVYLKSTTAGDVVIKLQDNAGTDLQTTTITLPAGNATTPVQFTLPLNFAIQPGTGYRLVAISGPSMVRESGLGGFPYAVGSVASVTSGYNSGTTTGYFYFYNWNFKTVCASPRAEVVATVATAPAFILSTATVSICAGQNSAPVTVTTGNADYDTYAWSPSAGVSGSAVTGWIFNPSVSTTYVLTASQSTGALCATTKNVAVTVNPMPSAVTANASSTETCANSIVTLSATGGTIIGAGTIGTNTALTGTTEQPTAFCNRWPSYWSQTIYTAADLTAAGLIAGNITSMAYNIATLGDAATNANFTVSIGTVAGATFANTTFLATTGFTTVYGPASYTHTASGWNVIPFTTPFVWDGVSNIVINVTQSGADNLYNSQTEYTATAGNTTLWVYSFTGTTTTGTTSVNRLNIRFAETSPTQITWAPTTNLFADNAATVPYTGTAASTVYFKSATAGTATYTATAASPQNCSVTSNVGVDVTVVAAPTGDSTQIITANSAEEATIEDLVAVGTDVTWFESLADALAFANPMQPGAQIFNGQIYFASQTIDACYSADPLAVTVTVTLGTNDFDMPGLKYYPNPVSDVFTLNYTQEISNVEVYNMLGQRILSVIPNATTAVLKMEALAPGAYIVQVKAGNGQSKAIKVIKN